MNVNNFILTVDVGNTHSKACLLDEKHCILNTFPLNALEENIQTFGLTTKNTVAAICSVKSDFPPDQIPFDKLLVGDYFHSSKKQHSFMDMPVQYTKTLGLDRLVQAWYLYHQLNCNKENSKENNKEFNKDKKLLIDTGTFTTVDFIDTDGLKGGFILPGLGTILNSYSSGDQLSAYNSINTNAKNMDKKELNLLVRDIAHSTADAIERGAFITFLAPLLKIIEQNPEYSPIITGGNAFFLETYLKNQNQEDIQPLASIHFEMNLIHIALATFVGGANKL